MKSICNELLLRQEESFFSNQRLNKYRADGGSANTRLQRAHLGHTGPLQAAAGAEGGSAIIGCLAAPPSRDVYV